MISSEGLQAVLSLEAWSGLFQGEEYHPRVLYLTPAPALGIILSPTQERRSLNRCLSPVCRSHSYYTGYL